MKKVLSALLFSALLSPMAQAADYKIDVKGTHAFINFKISHLGYSWLTGRFNEFDGSFSFDEKNPNAAQISLDINPSSVDTNHSERDKHIRSKDFLHVNKFPDAGFESTRITHEGDNKYKVIGDLTMHGVTKQVIIDAYKVGEGKDPWGGYRAGFSGTTKIKMEDFGIKNVLGPASAEIEFQLHIEGIRQ
ncbi:YceI family protein [Alteromonas sp. a30]|uniref:YceI family protein n=1 Tax=Alteromonas sp. a30 TaxID=2730917 RepID=UPI002281166F|nr:YceI family protein [Alteromonas sp. a30]MCY7295474.1 YceI family protein [Alteromonas sp. a30]